MNRLRHGTALVTSLVAVTTLAVSGCSAVHPQSGTGMMDGGANPSGLQMMETPSGQQYSPVSCRAPDALPGTRVEVVLSDMGMTRMMGGVAPMGSVMALRASPTRVFAGQVTLVASNLGWRTHELVVLPLSGEVSAGQRIPDAAQGTIAETGSLDEASSSCNAGPGDGITSGSTGWVTLTLPAGRYELVCNLRNHYAAGMHQELVVT